MLRVQNPYINYANLVKIDAGIILPIVGVSIIFSQGF